MIVISVNCRPNDESITNYIINIDFSLMSHPIVLPIDTIDHDHLFTSIICKSIVHIFSDLNLFSSSTSSRNSYPNIYVESIYSYETLITIWLQVTNDRRICHLRKQALVTAQKMSRSIEIRWKIILSHAKTNKIISGISVSIFTKAKWKRK